MRQQLIDFTRPLCRQAWENTLQIHVRVMAVEPRRLDQTRVIAAARFPLRSDPAGTNQQRAVGIAFSIALCHGFEVASIEGDSHGQAGRLVQRFGLGESFRYEKRTGRRQVA
jgi:hypothetical protein